MGGPLDSIDASNASSFTSPSCTSQDDRQQSYWSWVKGVGCTTTGAICGSRRHYNDSKFGHKPYSLTGYFLLELHQNWSIYSQVWIMGCYEFDENIWGVRSLTTEYNKTPSLCLESECAKKDLPPYIAINFWTGSGYKESGTP